MIRIIALFYFAFFAESIIAQSASTQPCSSPECTQFDFWLGDWDLTYNDSIHATNHITKEMGNCVVYEHFNDPSQSFSGASWSVFNSTTNLWQQCWVDNQGGYILLTGKYGNGEMVLFTEERKLSDGSSGKNKMRFYNITSLSFDWNWEVTKDGGKSWTILWKIHYSRKKP